MREAAQLVDASFSRELNHREIIFFICANFYLCEKIPGDVIRFARKRRVSDWAGNLPLLFFELRGIIQ
jgi:hypothetical protein